MITLYTFGPALGLGRHSRAEIETLGCRDIDALAALLGDQPYLLGDTPCGADACAYAFVAGLLCPVFETALRTQTERHANLCAYAARMQARYFPASA